MSTLEDAARDLIISRYLNLVAFAILYYDYGLTLSLEYERYWFNKFTWTVFLFFLVRYSSIIGHIPVILDVFIDEAGSLCSVMLLYHQIFAIVIQVFVGVLLIVRTYALYNRNRWVLGVTVGVAISGATVACWAVLIPHGSPPSQPGDEGCNVDLSNLQGLYFAIAWGSLLVFDCLIFALTFVRAITLSQIARRTLFDIMLRDGTLYFACMAGANLGNIVTFILCSPGLKGVPTIFTNVISTTLISRLMLNIRDPKLLSRARSQTTTVSNSAGPLTRTDNLPFYSTLYPIAGDISTPVSGSARRIDQTYNSESFELHFLDGRGERG